MSGPASKIAKMVKKIGTHNGTFHCDEVLACFMLKQLEEYSDASITRTRDASVLDTCDIVVDVGGVFDASKLRFDHHQRTFNETVSSLCPEKPWKTKLSSAGLVYVHFGHKILSEMLKKPEKDPLVQTIFDKVYENFIEEVDAIDNGINTSDGEMKYLITTNLSSRVAHLNPAWNDPNTDEQEGFDAALKLVGGEFKERVSFYSSVWWPARSLVEEAVKARHNVDSSGEIVCLEKGGCPWKEHLYAIEASMNIEPKIKFMLYTDIAGKWRVQTVPVKQGSFESRVPLLEAWRGVRDEKLSSLSGIDGCIFVHASGFIGGNETYDGALKMAKTSLNV